MDDGYMSSWNDCYAKINELYKENSDSRAKIGKYEIQLKQAQTMIDELEMLRVAQNKIIKALNEALSDRKEFIDKQQEMIDRLELKRVSNLHLIKEQKTKLNDMTLNAQTQKRIISEQKERITTLTTEIENLKEKIDSLADFINYIH